MKVAFIHLRDEFADVVSSQYALLGHRLPPSLLEGAMVIPMIRIGNAARVCPRNNREMNLHHCQTPTSTEVNIVKNCERYIYSINCASILNQNMRGSLSLCMGVAALYFVGVSIGGGGSFDGKKVPESYYDFLMSDNVQNFDFDAFVIDIERQYRMNAIHGNNELQFSIEKGYPSATFERIQTEAESSGDLRREEDQMIQELEIERFLNLQRFAPTSP